MKYCKSLMCNTKYTQKEAVFPVTRGCVGGSLKQFRTVTICRLINSINILPQAQGPPGLLILTVVLVLHNDSRKEIGESDVGAAK